MWSGDSACETRRYIVMIAIIGAGLAGLTCAKCLAEAGCSNFLLLEAALAPGGRLRSEKTGDGFVIDAGFQVLLENYPSVRRHLDLEALNLRPFEAGALIPVGEGKLEAFENPLRHPGGLRHFVNASYMTAMDRLRLSRLGASVLMQADEAYFGGRIADLSTMEYLEETGMSEGFIEAFWRPFFGGVLLDEKLETSSILFRYYLKQFLLGKTSVPAGGIQAIPEQLASRVPPEKIRYGKKVREIELKGDRAVRIRFEEDAEALEITQIILCTDKTATAGLMPEHTANHPRFQDLRWQQTTCVYLQSETSLTESGKIILMPGKEAVVPRHFCQLSNVAPSYAPAGKHLISATVLGNFGENRGDEEWFHEVRRGIGKVFPGAEELLEALTVVRVKEAVPRQLPGLFDEGLPVRKLPGLSNVRLAGDQVSSGSIEGAMSSGARAAQELLEEEGIVG